MTEVLGCLCGIVCFRHTNVLWSIIHFVVSMATSHGDTQPQRTRGVTTQGHSVLRLELIL